MYYQIEKMDGYYRIGSMEQVFCYVLVGTQKAMLIDTGYAYSDMKAAVRSITDLPLIIINTHGHCDHTGGNAQFEEICYLHEADVELCKEHNTPEMRRANANRAAHSMDFMTGKEYNALPEGFDMEAYASAGYGWIGTVKEGDVFSLGGITAEIVETPGHTAGGISIWYKEKNLVFIGDCTGMFVWLFAPEATGKDSYLKTVDKLLGLHADGYIGGHCPDVLTYENLLRYKKAAEEADFSKGEIFQSFFENAKESRVCPLDGMTIDDMFNPNFAAVVINEDWGK